MNNAVVLDSVQKNYPDFSALLLPALIRFGLEKGKLIMMAFMFGMMAVFTFMGDIVKNPDGMLRWLSGISHPMLIAALLLTGVLFSVISFLLSLHWMPHAVIR